MLKTLFAASFLTLGITAPAFAAGIHGPNDAGVAKLPEMLSAEAETQDCLGDAESRPPETLQVDTAAGAGNGDDPWPIEFRSQPPHDCALV